MSSLRFVYSTEVKMHRTALLSVANYLKYQPSGLSGCRGWSGVYVCVHTNYFLYSPPVNNEALHQGYYDPPLSSWRHGVPHSLPIFLLTQLLNPIMKYLNQGCVCARLQVGITVLSSV